VGNRNTIETITAGNRLYKIFADMAGYYSQPIEGTNHYRVRYRVIRNGKEYGPEFFLSANPTFTHAFGQTETSSGHVSRGYATMDDAKAAIAKHSTEKPYRSPRVKEAL
jgi:hypothetical protein